MCEKRCCKQFLCHIFLIDTRSRFTPITHEQNITLAAQSSLGCFMSSISVPMLIESTWCCLWLHTRIPHSVGIRHRSNHRGMQSMPYVIATLSCPHALGHRCRAPGRQYTRASLALSPGIARIFDDDLFFLFSICWLIFFLFL
jgi:hypothetical protein